MCRNLALLVALGWAMAAVAAEAPELPEALRRVEAALLRSPQTGGSFDRLTDHFARHPGGLSALAMRWQTWARDTERPAVERAGAWLLAALVAERQQQSAEALAAIDEALALRPRWVAARLVQGRLLAQQGATQKAAEVLEGLLAENLSLADWREAGVRLARLEEQRAGPVAAAAVWQRLLTRAEGDPELLEEVALAVEALGQPAVAVEAWARLVEAVAGDPVAVVAAQLRQAQALLEVEPASAIPLLEIVLAATLPGNWRHDEALRAVETAFLRQRDQAGLVAWYERQWAQGGEPAWAAHRLGQLWAGQGRPTEAARWLAQAVRLAPDNREWARQYEEALLDGGLWDEALRWIIGQRQARPNDRTLALREGEIRWRQAGPDDAAGQAAALAVWAGVADLAGSELAAWLDLAETYRRFGRTDEASTAFQRAVMLAPEDWELRERVGLYLLNAGRRDAGWATLEGGPRRPLAASVRLVQILLRENRADTALQTLAAALAVPGVTPSYAALELRFRLLTEAQRWDEALAAFPALLAAAPHENLQTELEERLLRLLDNSQRLTAWQEAARRQWAEGTGGLAEGRLWARALVAAKAHDEAGAVLAVLRTRFPADLGVVRLQAQWLNSLRRFDAAVATWQALAEAEPRHLPEAARAIAEIWQGAQRWAEAAQATEAWLQASPLDARAHAQLAELRWQTGDPEGGNVALREAIRVAAAPQPYRLRLARALSAQGQVAEAAKAYLDAYAGAGNESDRAPLLRPMTDAFWQAGRLDELVLAFGERLRPVLAPGERERALAEVFQQTQDIPRAREALARAHAAAPGDAGLVRQLRTLAQGEGDRPAELHWTRVLARLEPSPGLDLAQARLLLEAGDAEAAFALLRTRPAEILPDASAWQPLLPLAARAGRQTELVELVRQATMARGADWRALLGLAELLLAQGEAAAAEPILWQLAALPPAEAFAGPSPVGSPAFGSYDYWARLMAVSAQSRAAFVAWRERGGPTPVNVAPTTAMEARTAALVYLSAQAALARQDEAFVARLATQMAEVRAPWALRAMSFLQVQARRWFLDEIELHLGQAERDLPAESYIVEILCNTVFLRRAGPDEPRMRQLIDRLFDRLLPEGGSAEAASLLVGLTQRMEATGVREGAREVLTTWRARWSQGPVPGVLLLGQRWLALGGAVGEVEATLVGAMRRALADGQVVEEARAAVLPLLQAHLQRDQSWPADATWAVMTELFVSGPGEPESAEWPADLGPWFNFPLPNRWLSTEAMGQWQQVLSLARVRGRTEDLQLRLQQVAATREGRVAEAASLLLALGHWWEGRPGDAQRTLQALLDRTGAIALRAQLAEVLWNSGQREAALAEARRVAPAQGGLRLWREVRTAQWGMTLGQAPLAREAVGELLALRPPPIPGFSVELAAQELGLRPATATIGRPVAERAAVGPIRPLATVGPGPSPSSAPLAVGASAPLPASQRWQSLPQISDPATLEREGRAILREVPPGAWHADIAAPRRMAILALWRANQLDAYVAELERQRRVSPQSTRVLHALYEVAVVGEGVASLPGAPQGRNGFGSSLQWLRQLASQRPTDGALQRTLAARLYSAGAMAELGELFDRELSRDPWALLAEVRYLAEVYTRLNRLPELAAKLQALAALPGAGSAVGGVNRADLLRRVGEDLRRAGAEAVALELWLAAFAETRGPAQFELALELLPGLRQFPERQVAILETVLLPPPLVVDPVTWLGRREDQSLPGWVAAPRPDGLRAVPFAMVALRQATAAVQNDIERRATLRVEANASGPTDLAAHLTRICALVGRRAPETARAVTELLRRLETSSDPQAPLQLALLEETFWQHLGNVLEGEAAFVETALVLAERTIRAADARALTDGNFGPRLQARLRAAQMLWQRGDTEAARRRWEEAESIWQGQSERLGGLPDPATTIAFAEAVAEAGQWERVRRLLTGLARYGQWRQNLGFAQRADELRRRLEEADRQASPPVRTE